MTLQFTQHCSSYPGIDPSSPDLSQAEKTVFITGGAFGIGYAIAEAFARANAATIILLDKDPKGLEDALTRIRNQVPQFQGHIIPLVCSLQDELRLDEAWTKLTQQGLQIDVMILNAAEIGAAGLLSRMPLTAIWEPFTVNVRSNLYLAQRFLQQKSVDPCTARHV